MKRGLTLDCPGREPGDELPLEHRFVAEDNEAAQSSGGDPIQLTVDGERTECLR